MRREIIRANKVNRLITSREKKRLRKSRKTSLISFHDISNTLQQKWVSEGIRIDRHSLRKIIQ
jgi:hypothetical protein